MVCCHIYTLYAYGIYIYIERERGKFILSVLYYIYYILYIKFVLYIYIYIYIIYVNRTECEKRLIIEK